MDPRSPVSLENNCVVGSVGFVFVERKPEEPCSQCSVTSGVALCCSSFRLNILEMSGGILKLQPTVKQLKFHKGNDFHL